MNVQRQDINSVYLEGVQRLLDRLGPTHPDYSDVLLYKSQLLEISLEEKYGDPVSQSRRSRIVNQLNLLALSALGCSFIELCGYGERPAAWEHEERTYRQQIARIHGDIRFEDITIAIREIFIQLQTERHINAQLDRELLKLQRQAERSANDKDKIARLQRVRNRLVHAAASSATSDVTDTLATSKYMVILGDPGAGKTTLLKHLAITCAIGDPADVPAGLRDEQGRVLLPIFVSLGEFASVKASGANPVSLLEYLYTSASSRLMHTMPAGFFEAALTSGRCLVCLDGLDEIWTKTERQTICSTVKALVNRFPENRYVVTSRIVGYKEAPLDPREFVHHTVLPLNNDRIHQFISSWYTISEPDPTRASQQIEKLQQTLARQPRIQALARNPLLLTIITLVHQSDSDLPFKRVKLYELCVKALIQSWYTSDGISAEKLEEFKQYIHWLLERLAYELQTMPGQSGQMQMIREGDLELLFEDILKETRRPEFVDNTLMARETARTFINIIRSRTGLLVERGAGVFGFPHLTFQEYLAACDLERRYITRTKRGVQIDKLWQVIRFHIHESHWREVILLLLGNLNSYENGATRLIERILDAGGQARFDSVFHYHLYLAARALADQVDVSVKIRRRIIDALLQIAQSDHQWQREDAFAALALVSEDYHVSNSLLELVRNPALDIGIRAEAAKAVGSPGQHDEVIDALLHVAHDTQAHVWVRRATILALAQIDRAHQRIATRLLSLAEHDAVDVEIRRASIMALAQLGRSYKQAIAPLQRLARNRQADPSLRLTLAVVLGQSGDANTAVKVLLELIDKPTLESTIRAEAARAFGPLGRTDPDVISPLMIMALNPRIPTDIRIEATRALGRLGRSNEIVMRRLLALAKIKQTDTEIRRTAAMALGRGQYAKEAINLLIDLGRAQPADTIHHGIIVHALRKIGRDPQLDYAVRFRAAEALRELRCLDEMIGVLLELAYHLRDQADSVGHAAEVLVALAHERDVDIKIRNLAAEALAQIDHIDEARTIFLNIANNRNDVDGGDRYLAAVELAHIGSPTDAMHVLLDLARNRRTNPGVRRNSIVVLLSLARDDDMATDLQQTITTSIRAMANDLEIDAEVRLIAATALSRIGDPHTAIQLLYELWNNRKVSLSVRRDATNALLRLVRDGAIDPETRQAAARVLYQMGRTEKTVEKWLKLVGDHKAEHQVRLVAGKALADFVRDQQIDVDYRRDVLRRLKQVLPT